MWTGSLCRTNTGPEREVQNVITIHDQGNGISILNVWGSVCENRLFRAQILPFWFKSSYAWIECPGQWNLLRRDQARINPGLEQIQILLPSAWLGLRNLTDERPSEDKPGLGQIKTLLPPAWPGLRNLIVERPSEDKPGLGLINKVLPTAWTKWPGQRNFTAEWLSEDKPGLGQINTVFPIARTELPGQRN